MHRYMQQDPQYLPTTDPKRPKTITCATTECLLIKVLHDCTIGSSVLKPGLELDGERLKMPLCSMCCPAKAKRVPLPHV